MPTKVTVPQLGEGVEEVTIVNWLKTEGDHVDEYEGLVEVETDKVVTEIPSPAAGTLLKIYATTVDASVPVGTVLAWIGEPGDTIPDEPDGSSKQTELQIDPEGEEKTKEPSPGSEEPIQDLHGSLLKIGRSAEFGFISPVVAKIAAENNIDLSKVTGTGGGGRITKRDVMIHLQNGTIKSPAALQPRPQTEQHSRTIPHSSIRRRIADHMVMSKRTSPHVTTLMEADLSRVAEHRQANKDIFAKSDTRLTYTAYFVSASVEALKLHPLVNSSWGEDEIRVHKEINIGMATDLGEDGLIVPVIKNAGDLSLLGIAKDVNTLANRARSKKLSPGDVQGATFSITNHGVSGSLLATPIINQPQCAILGVGAIQKRVVVLTDEFGNDSIAIRPMTYLTLTFDHRILDGAGADHFLAMVVESLENW
jgi:2-oxoglutarate dehydrogenase E2 component (dihydrolipoamide succinyltransferase)